MRYESTEELINLSEQMLKELTEWGSGNKEYYNNTVEPFYQKLQELKFHLED